MTWRHKRLRRESLFRAASPDQLLLLTIFGGEQVRHDVDNELDRRALMRRMLHPELKPHCGGNRAA